jgi:hypothetical protein
MWGVIFYVFGISERGSEEGFLKKLKYAKKIDFNL